MPESTSENLSTQENRTPAVWLTHAGASLRPFGDCLLATEDSSRQALGEASLSCASHRRAPSSHCACKPLALFLLFFWLQMLTSPILPNRALQTLACKTNPTTFTNLPSFFSSFAFLILNCYSEYRYRLLYFVLT